MDIYELKCQKEIQLFCKWEGGEGGKGFKICKILCLRRDLSIPGWPGFSLWEENITKSCFCFVLFFFCLNAFLFLKHEYLKKIYAFVTVAFVCINGSINTFIEHTCLVIETCLTLWSTGPTDESRSVVWVLLVAFTRSSLVLLCGCVQRWVHAKTSNVPEGPQELSLIQLFRDFSYRRNGVGQGFSFVAAPTSTVVQPGLSFSVYQFYQEDELVLGWSSSTTPRAVSKYYLIFFFSAFNLMKFSNKFTQVSVCLTVLWTRRLYFPSDTEVSIATLI